MNRIKNTIHYLLNRTSRLFQRAQMPSLTRSEQAFLCSVAPTCAQVMHNEQADH